MRLRLTVKCLAAAIALAAAGGCIHLGGTLPPLELYRLAPRDSTALATNLESSTVALRLAPGTIAVAPYSTPGIYGDPNIPYRVGEAEYGTYPSRQWAIPLSTMLGEITASVLDARRVTTGAATYAPPAYRGYDYVWQGTVRNMEEVDRGGDVSAVVRLDARIVRSSDDSVVWTGTITRERAVATPTMDAIVSTLSDLSTLCVAQLADDARASMAHLAAASTPR